MTAAELADRLKGRLTGDGTRRVSRVETLDAAEADCVSWLGHAKYAQKLETTAAGVVLVPQGAPAPANLTTIAVADPDLALNDVLMWLYPPADTVPAGIHPTAVVDPSAKVAGAAIGPRVVVGPGSEIGEGTQLHAGVVIGSEVRIGRDCVLWPNVVVRERSTIGDRVIIQPNATIGSDGFGYLQRGGRHLKVPQVGVVVIEDDVEIGAGTCVDRAKSGVTRIGRGTKIDNLVQVAHNNEIGPDCIIVAQTGLAGSCRIGRGVVIGGQVGSSDHLKIGDGATIVSQAGLMRDVPPGAVVSGSPAMDHRDFLRLVRNWHKLSELMEHVRGLTGRVERLEQAAHD
jgi:UDP-3-O-[3-hydroxymyristoyl] glucosamine N-acyltransferase